MARSIWLVILIKNIYTLWGQNLSLLPDKFLSTNLVYPFSLRVTGIIISKFNRVQIGCLRDLTSTPHTVKPRWRFKRIGINDRWRFCDVCNLALSLS